MTPARNLGPLLAAGFGVLTLGAAIAGLLITGGPGQTRDRRLDDMTLEHIGSLSAGVECAVRFSGQTPATKDEIFGLIAKQRLAAEGGGCGLYVHDVSNLLRSWQDLDYQRLSDRRYSVCASFRLSGTGPDELSTGREWSYAAPELLQPRPAPGRHCYEISLPEFPDVQ